MYFLFNRTTLPVFVTYLTGALYVHPLWFYKHQHDNRDRSKLFVACQWWWFQWRFWFVQEERICWAAEWIYRVIQMIVGVLTTCHTQHTWNSSICIFYLIEHHPKFLLHTLQVLYMCTLCDSTNINTIIEFVPNWQVVKTPTIVSNKPVCKY